MEIRSYPNIYNLGHKELEGFLDDEVIVEEKIDGSQISFGLIEGAVCARSKGQRLDMDAPEKMFIKACEVIRNLASQLQPGWTYRAEYLLKPKHNTLAYDRVPQNHLIVFDIDQGDQRYLGPEEKAAESRRLELECVPFFFKGKIESFNAFKQLLETVSCLGGQKIEGVVIKNYQRYGADKKVLMAKYVSEEFKETHKKDWKLRHPASKDIKEIICDSLRTEARWRKAVQHLRERGEITETPKDIGALMKEVNQDILKECIEEIKQDLFDWAWKDISRGIVRGFPQWYKDELAKKQFDE